MKGLEAFEAGGVRKEQYVFSAIEFYDKRSLFTSSREEKREGIGFVC